MRLDRRPPGDARARPPLGALAAAALVAASVVAACGDRTRPVAPPAAPRDTSAPSVRYDVVQATDGTVAIAGEATDDRAVTAVTWRLVATGAAAPDTARGAADIRPARTVAFRAELPPGLEGQFELRVEARDSAGNVGAAPARALDQGPPRPRFEVVVTPAGDTVWQRGAEVGATLAPGYAMRQARIYVDSGLPGEWSTTVPWWALDGTGGPGFAGIPIPVPTPGRHTITVVASPVAPPGAGRERSVTVSRVFAVTDTPYALATLPDLGGEADALGLSARDDVAGWVAAPGGRRRAAVWRNGAVEVLPLPDTADVAATRVNAAGDVLLQFGQPDGYAAPSSVRVRRADGTLLTLGTDPCCTLAAALTEGRLALATTGDDPFRYRSALLDAATGRLVDSSAYRLLVLNERGQMAGTWSGGYSYRGRYLHTVGFTAPERPPGELARACDIAGRWTTSIPIDLDDDANLLMSLCGNPLLLPASGTGVWLERVFGPVTAVRMAPRGGLIVALDSAGGLYAWRRGTRGPRRLRVPGDAWRFDALGAVSASGAVAAHGVHRTTGRRAALLLTPAGR